MSLLSSLQIANNSLLATQVGLQVIGNNIANAHTEGYSRQEVIYDPAPTQMIGPLPLGLGVHVKAIVQRTDKFLNERLRGAISDVENTETQKQRYLQLESIMGEMGDADLSTSLNRFFSSINDVLNQPEDPSVRNLAMLQGRTLTEDIRRLDSRVRQVRKDVNDSIVGTARDINRLLNEIAELNVQIVAMEGTSTSGSNAGGLRDQRNLVLADLAEFVAINTVEQPSGAVTVFASGDYLVSDGTARPVSVEYTESRGLSIATINIADSDSPIETSSGRLAGFYTARDGILGGFLDGLNEFTQTLIFEFNKVFSSGQGLSGYESLESEFFVSSQSAALDQAGLTFTPVNGTFQLQVYNRRTGLTTTNEIRVDLNGLDEDTTLATLADELDAIDGVSAEVTSELRLRITSDSPELEFAFARDTSGLLAALGINTFFSGESSDGIGVTQAIRDDPSKFATSQSGVGEDTANAVILAGLANAPLAATGGRSILEQYESFSGNVFQASSSIQAINDGFRTFHKTLEGQQFGISGVNIDEQAVKLIQHQRIFQASARVIGAVNQLLDLLVNL